MVRVLVDGAALGDGSSVRGIGSVLRHICRGLVSEPDLDIVVMVPPEGPSIDGATRHVLSRRGPGRFGPWEHLLLSGLGARRARPDVAWFPANLTPVLPPRTFVATVHDVIPLQLDDDGLAADRRRWRTFGRGLRKAASVLCPSQATADAAVDVLHLRTEQVQVVPWGIDDRFSPIGPEEALHPPHILWVNAYDAHKGLAEACALVAALATRGLPHRLRLVGPFDTWNRSAVDRVVACSPRPDLVDVVGWVDDLAAAYRDADAFVITSRVEGFGLPPVEAQACGTPVVGFASPAVAEVAGPGALLVPLGDARALADAAVRILTDEAASAALVSSGLTNAARFSWAPAIEAYAHALRAAAASTYPRRR